MARNYGTAQLKNHILGKAPGTLNAMHKLFGVSAEDFAKAVAGDQEVIQRIADLNRLSKVARDNLPKALEAYKNIIEVTGDVNKAYAELVQDIQKHGTSILKAASTAQTSNQRFINESQEIKAEFVNATTQEETRHAQRSNLIAISGAAADLMALARYEADLNKAAAVIPNAQDAADLAYEKAVTAELWSKGSEAKPERIPKPNYQRTAGVAKVGEWFRNFLGL